MKKRLFNLIMNVFLSHIIKNQFRMIAIISFLCFINIFSASDIRCADENVKEPDFRFGVLTDVHYCDCDPKGSRYYRQSLKKLEECVKEFNLKELSFVIQLGDIIDRGFGSFDDVLSIYSKLKMPCYHVLGNSDFSIKDNEKTEINKKLGLKSRYYDFAYKSWRFVVLDGTDLSLYADPESSGQYRKAFTLYEELKKAGMLNAQTWNGGLGDKQIIWLKNILKKACKSGEKVILFCHFPVFPKKPHNLWNNKELINIIESFNCVVTYMNGHNHKGNYAVKNGIHYLNLKGMVETPGENAYAIVEAYPNHLKVIGYGREQSRTLYLK